MPLLFDKLALGANSIGTYDGSVGSVGKLVKGLTGMEKCR